MKIVRYGKSMGEVKEKMMKLFDLTDRVAVVSGAAQGLGRATALALAQHGADLVLVDRNLSGAEATATEIQVLGRKTLVALRLRPDSVERFSNIPIQDNVVDPRKGPNA